MRVIEPLGFKYDSLPIHHGPEESYDQRYLGNFEVSCV